jgi:hypothetical protein
MRHFPLVLVAFLLAGCSGSPSFRNVVFEKVSKTAHVLNPVGTLQSPSIGYRFPPGSIVTARLAEFPNPFTRVAGLIPGQVDNQCFQRAFRLSQLGPVKTEFPNEIPTEVDASYVFDSSFGSQAALAKFREDHRLQAIPDNVFAFIRETSFHIDHIKVYEPTPAQLKIALDDALKDCSSTAQVPATFVVRRVYRGNVRSHVRWDDGVNVSLGKFKGAVQRSLRDNFDGRGVIFAVEVVPL